MKWLICSDTHDNLAHVEAMLDAERDADLLLHCGDIVSPFTLNYLAERFPSPFTSSGGTTTATAGGWRRSPKGGRRSPCMANSPN